MKFFSKSAVLHYMQIRIQSKSRLCSSFKMATSLKYAKVSFYNRSVSASPWTVTVSELGPCLRLLRVVLFPFLLLLVLRAAVTFTSFKFRTDLPFAPRSPLVVAILMSPFTERRCPCFVRFLFSRPFNRELCPAAPPGKQKAKAHAFHYMDSV